MNLQLSKREQNRIERREGIIDIATHAFLDTGYAATSMSTIAAELGGSKGTLWSYFGSKEELFTAVLDRLIATDAAEIESMIAGRSYSREGLRNFSIRFIELLLKPMSVKLFRLVIGEGGRFPELREMFHRNISMRIIGTLYSYFTTEFGEEDGEALAHIHLSALLGYRSKALMREDQPSPAEITLFVDRLLNQLALTRNG